MEHRIKPFSQNGLFVMFENIELQVYRTNGGQFFYCRFFYPPVLSTIFEIIRKPSRAPSKCFGNPVIVRTCITMTRYSVYRDSENEVCFLLYFRQVLGFILFKTCIYHHTGNEGMHKAIKHRFDLSGNQSISGLPTRNLVNNYLYPNK